MRKCLESNETYNQEESVATAHAVCSLTLSVLGTLGNGLSVLLIFRGRLHTTGLAMILIIDLCLTNMVTSAFILPVIGINSIQGGAWIFGEDFCAAYGFMMYSVLSNELGIMLTITINQYLIVVHNFNTQTWLATHKKSKLFVLLNIPIAISLVYIAPLMRKWDAFGYEPRKGYCTLLNLSGSLSIKPTLNFAYILIIAVVIIYCYVNIYWKHHKSRVRTDTTTLTLNYTTPAATKSLTAAAPRQGKTSSSSRAARSNHLLKMISLILINFFLTYIPFMIREVVDPCLRQSMGVVTAILYISWSHVATNPLIYVFANRQIRSQWRRLLPCRVTRSMPFTTRGDSGGDGDGGEKGATKTKTKAKAEEDTVAVLSITAR